MCACGGFASWCSRKEHGIVMRLHPAQKLIREEDKRSILFAQDSQALPDIRLSPSPCRLPLARRILGTVSRARGHQERQLFLREVCLQVSQPQELPVEQEQLESIQRRGESKDKLDPSRLVTSDLRDTGGLQKELLLFTTHADPHTHLAQDSEQLKEVTQEKLEELWVRLLPCTTKMCQQISDNTPETQG
ncbi:unnamed protein product [Rangifer tarandus platyrhynchus]|uniref:Uncharacterized protein n=1 Tax=Rangifer tarandus platyrhynchus TaxID=3082113 RepID=A0ABN8Z4W1_RANTA|nr:unnamed protein product [Rangifer tarandus platyrhynchus]